MLVILTFKLLGWIRRLEQATLQSLIYNPKWQQYIYLFIISYHQIGQYNRHRWVGVRVDIQGRIRELIEERSWTEYRLAKEANLSHSTVANMFNRNNAPTFPTLEAICNAFQMTLSQFFCEDGNLIELTDEEKELISRWKQLSAEQRKVLLELMGVI